MRKSIFRVLTGSLLALSLPAFKAKAQTDLQQFIAQGCQDFKRKLLANRRISIGYEQVPKNWQAPNGAKVPLFWWKRSGSPNYPPLLLLHGGPGGNSTGFLVRMPKLLDTYPGDIFSLDQRGEGCSNNLPGNLAPSNYTHLKTRNTVYDLEFLRKKHFQGRPWRALGQSRGSIILHYYLEMHPDSLESVHAHGWSIMPAHLAPSMTRLRAIGYQRASAEYVRKFPGDISLLQKIRASISPITCWNSFEGRRHCGPEVIDVFALDLARFALWENLHKSFNSVINPDGSVDSQKVYSLVAERIKFDLFAHLNFIVGTFAQELAYPDYQTLLKLTGSPEFDLPLLSEVRWLRNGILPVANLSWSTQADPVDYIRIRRYLESHPKFKYYLYSGVWDPAAPMEMFDYEVRTLGSNVNYTNFQTSGHDGWWSEEIVAQRLMTF
jgi:pimeloyl-ACP methyl ester carboxylesterase